MSARLALALVLAATGCGAPPPVVAQVEVHGSLRDGMQGEALARVDRGGVPWLALGALSGLRGEVTVAFGQVVCSYPDRDGIRTVVGPEAEAEQVAFFVASRTTTFRPVTLERACTLLELERRVEELAAARGVDVAAPFPFVVSHQAFTRLELHVIDGSRLPPGASSADPGVGVPVVREGAAAHLVGFWSRRHEGVITRRGERAHVHAVLLQEDGSPALTGHLDDARIPAGATLLLPASRPD